MCSNLKKNGKLYIPYTIIPIQDYRGVTLGVWGVDSHYNSRIETLVKNKWIGFHLSYIQVDSFYEGKGLFENISSTHMYLACARRSKTNNFTIITKPSKDTIIEPYHSRMPIVLERPDFFINSGKIIEINYSEKLRLAI